MILQVLFPIHRQSSADTIGRSVPETQDPKGQELHLDLESLSRCKNKMDEYSDKISSLYTVP
jgi:hypothetical protein